MRPNKIGWGLVLFFFVGGAIFYFTIPQIFIGQIWMGVSLGLAALYLFMNWRADRADELRESGVRATAEILKMTQTGVYINNMPQVKLKLRVEASELPSYEVERTLTVPHIALGALSSGRPLTVYVDRNDHEELVVDWGAAAFAGSQGDPPKPVEDEEEPMERLEKLRSLKNANLITEAEYQEQKKRILEDI